MGTARLNDVDPQAWLADALGRIAESPQTHLDELSGIRLDLVGIAVSTATPAR